MTDAARILVPETPEDTLSRAARAVLYVLERYSAPELQLVIHDMREPDLLDVRTVVTEALTYTAAHTYALCLMTRSDVNDAGRLFRSREVQSDLLMRARRVIHEVLL